MFKIIIFKSILLYKSYLSWKKSHLITSLAQINTNDFLEIYF